MPSTIRTGLRSPLWLLAPGQVISWGTLYYGITFLAQPMHLATGWSLSFIFSAYSAGLLVAALCAPLAGRLLVRHGGRWGLSLGSVLAAVSLTGIAVASHPVLFLSAWLVAGAAMSLTLYEAAFTALRAYSDAGFRRAMTTLTLVGGFASTVFWPLSYWLEAHFGWQPTLLVFAALHVLVCLPLHRLLPAHMVHPNPLASVSAATANSAALLRSAAFWGLAIAIATTALVSGALSAHAGQLLTSRGVDQATLLLAVSLFGPMQVAGRVIDMAFAQKLSVRWSGYVAHLILPLAICLLAFTQFEPRLAFLFAALYGAGNGVLTIVRGMAPAELLGQAAYGSALGWVSAPGLMARAIAPALAAFTLEHWGHAATLAWLIVIGFGGLAAFMYAYRATHLPIPRDARVAAT
ncbi:MFS transporter [Chitinimonas arctica]|uniref:MFS transporter n=1 Tax=Chitinimonas arctica TaxID=2594795 RepID=A0A516SD44_9NEIS|nr:MFS transporter [Chitinimonas arctica]QDQ26085.1 MFS transporter [Chitinimonas arctica]